MARRLTLDPDPAPALAASRRYSLDICARLEERLARAELPHVLCVVAAGSLGRLEAGVDSDLDCIVVCEDGAPSDPAAVDQSFAPLLCALDACGMKPPKAAGIYRTPITPAALLDPADRGSLCEPAARFGKRMQFLLDTRPLFGRDAFIDLRARVLDWYAWTEPARGFDPDWSFLIDDLTRYRHAYASWQRFRFDRSEDDSWYLRQAKLLSSRTITFAGLLLLLGASGHQVAGAREWVLRQLDRTPLERLQLVMGCDPEAWRQARALYDAMHQLLQRQRAALIAAGPDAARAMPAHDPEPFATVRRLSDEMCAVLTSFVLDRRDAWPRAFFSRLVL